MITTDDPKKEGFLSWQGLTSDDHLGNIFNREKEEQEEDCSREEVLRELEELKKENDE